MRMIKRTIRVATYNVLSSSLCSPSYFVNSEEKFCSSKYRLDGLFKKLRGEMDRNAIVCLQEVSLNWTGKLHTFFEANNYGFVVSNYGGRFNGYMGVGVAYPRSQYKLASSDIVCVPDSKVGGWSDPNVKRERRENNTAIVADENKLAIVVRKSAQTAFLPLKMLWRGFGSLLSATKQIWMPFTPRRAESPWDLAKNRVNTMVCLRLRPAESKEEDGLDFLVATYHMPCQFWEPATMSIHTVLCFQQLQQLAEGKYPHILAGDFNFKPNSPQYAFVTTGTFPPKVVDPEDPEVNGKASLPTEPLYPNDPFQYALSRGPYESAYARVEGKEPKFTNHAMTKDQTKPFTSTLDYIFYKDGEKNKGKKTTVNAVSVLDMEPTCEEIVSRNIKSLPNETEYSDHLLIAADFELVVE